ncbi:MAG: GspH/FimT family protein [Pseudomonadota bacterium]
MKRMLAGQGTGLHPGFTLLELLLVLAVLSISLQLTTAAFAPQLREMRSASAMNHVAGLMAYARHEALLRRRPVTVCVLDADNRCTRTWLPGFRLIAFVDTNANRRLEASDELLRDTDWPMTGAELSWRASLARPYIAFTETGGTWQNGTLYYCPETRDARQARALVVSHSGRAYATVDSNGDGIREDRTGKNLKC